MNLIDDDSELDLIDDDPFSDEVETGTITEVSDAEEEDPWGIGSFLLGCIMIPFSLALLWKNEKTQVNYARVIEQARDECRTIKADAPLDENDYKLVHCTGQAVNGEKITD